MRATVGMNEEEEEGEEIFFKKGSRVEVTSNEDGFTGAWYVATVLANPPPPSKKRSHQPAQMYFVEYDNLLTDDDPSKPLSEYVDVSFIRPLQPTADRVTGFQVNDVVDVNLRDGLWTGVVKRVLDGGSRFLVYFHNPPDEVECSLSDLRIHLDWVDQKWVRPNKQESNVLKDEERHLKKKRGTPRESLGKFMKGSRQGKKHRLAAGALNQIVMKDAVRISSRLQKGIFWSDSFNDFPSWISNKECRKLIADSKRAARHSNSRGKHGESIYEQLNFMVAEHRDKRSTMLLLKDSLDKTTSVNNGSPIQDPLDASNGKSSEVDNLESGARDATDVIDDEMPSHIFDRRALLTLFDAMNSTTPMNNEVFNGSAIEVNTESNDRQKHTATRTPSPAMPTQSLAVVANNVNVEESQNVPFTKSSPVWKTIESMEVFQKTPQRPHFSPLVKCREDSREGLAVGHMITYANLVERVLTLQVSHPQSIIESSLETLKELENHGFDVEAIHNRLTELQSLKNKVDELKDSSKVAEGEIMKLNKEKKEVEELMDKVEMKLKQIKEKLGAAASMKEIKVKQINLLQSKVNFFADSLESTKSDFERIAASPL